MNILSADNLGKDYGEKVLFTGLSFGLDKGDKAALIAANGTGKSSLLKILAGRDMADQGEVAIQKGIRTGFLTQDPVFDSRLSIREEIQRTGLSVRTIIRDYEATVADHSAGHTPETEKALMRATARMDQSGAWDFERRLVQMLDRFGIIDLDQKISELSGGQIKRLALALVLLDEPELLLLDEPTNHLDIGMIEWLEEYLSVSSITFLMVTHDRYFLDRICNRILELENGELYTYEGNYEKFLELKAGREAASRAEKDRARKYVERELDWIRRMPKARGTKSKSRIQAFREARERARAKKSQGELNLAINMRRVGGKILEIRHLSKKYGEKRLLSDFNYSFSKGEKVGIIGPNGSGKTTLLNLITGKMKPDSGSIVTGETIVYGYFSQEGMQSDDSKRVIDVVKDIAEVIETADGSRLSASQFLQFFLFPPQVQYDFVSKLSGGEKRRLHLLTVLVRNPNFLILDEPTNDLDIITLSRLEEFLEGFGGCLILVSHDRYLLDRLADHIFIFEGQGKIVDFYGSYSDYRIQKDIEREDAQEEERENGKSSTVKLKIPDQLSSKRRLTFKEKMEYEKLEKEIEELEKEKGELELFLNSGENDYEKLTSASERIRRIISLLDEKSLRWLELDELK